MTWTERGKSMINKTKDGRGKDVNNRDVADWESYDEMAWDEAWENPARGNGPTPQWETYDPVTWHNARGSGHTPGASSSSAAAADRW